MTASSDVLQGRQAKDAVSVLNKLDVDLAGNPIGMTEATDRGDSANFGTVRDPRKGGCYKGDGVAYVKSNNIMTLTSQMTVSYWLDLTNHVNKTTGWDTLFHKPFTSHISPYYYYYHAISTEGKMRIVLNTHIPLIFEYVFPKAIVRVQVITMSTELTLTVYNQDNDILYNYTQTRIDNQDVDYDTELYIGLNANDHSSYYRFNNIKIWDLKFIDDISGNEIAHYKLDENSGTTAYDSSGNGNHGQIINAITVPPEQNVGSIHQYQDQYSHHNTIGYSDMLSFNGTTSTLAMSAVNYDSANKVSIDFYTNKLPTVGIHTLVESSNDYELNIGSFHISINATNLIVGYSHATGIQWHAFTASGTGRYHIEIDTTLSGSDTIKLFIDDVQQTLTSTSGTAAAIVFVTADLHIGSRAGTSNFAEFTLSGFKLTAGNNILLTQFDLPSAADITKSFIPKDSSAVLQKDVFGNALQHVGSVPAKASFKESACFLGDGNGYLDCGTLGDYSSSELKVTCNFTYGGGIDQTLLGKSVLSGTVSGRWGIIILTSTSIHIYRTDYEDNVDLQIDVNLIVGIEYQLIYESSILNTLSRISILNTDGEILWAKQDTNPSSGENNLFHFLIAAYGDDTGSGGYLPDYGLKSNSKIYNVILYESDVIIGNWPLCEPIINPSNHTYYDVSGHGNHATLINGTTANEGLQDEFHYLQKGLSYANNFLKFSEDFTNGVWIAGGNHVLITSNYDDSPIGTNNASKAVESSDVGVLLHRMEQSSGGVTVLNDGDRVTVSIYAKRDESDEILENLRDIGLILYFGSGVFDQRISLADGECYSGTLETEYAFDFDFITTKINDYWKINLSFTTHEATYVKYAFDICEVDGYHSSANSYVGDGVSGVIIWGAQLSIHSRYPSVYYKTDAVNIINKYIPASSTTPAEDALGNPFTVPQDGNTFLPTGCSLQQYNYPALVHADDGARVFTVNKTSTYASVLALNGSDNFKLSCYVRFLSQGIIYPTIISLDDWTGFKFHLNVNGGIYIGTSVSTRYEPSTSRTLHDRIKTFVEFEWSAAIGTLFINGVEVGSGKSMPLSPWRGAKNLIINGGNTGDNYGSCEISDLIIRYGANLEHLYEWPLNKNSFIANEFHETNKGFNAVVQGTEFEWSGGLWYDHSASPITPNTYSNNYISAYVGKYQNTIFSDAGDDRQIKQIVTHSRPLRNRQLNTEETVRSVTPLTTNWILDGGVWDSGRTWENTNIWRDK